MENSIIIVLGNFMDKFDRLNEETCSRLNLAIEKFNNNQYSFIVTSGWDYHGKYDTAMAVAMKSYIVKNSDISYELVLTEENSRDTVGDAIFTKKKCY
jgi:putative cell wall-binding protein